MKRLERALDLVARERIRQEHLLEQARLRVHVSNPVEDELLKFSVLMEEIGEVAKALNETAPGARSLHDLQTELVQVAAVAVAWIEAIDDLLGYGEE